MELLGTTPRAPGRRFRAWRVLAGLAFLSPVLAPPPAVADPASEVYPTKEYQIKAVFLYNFVQFVEWPASAFADASSPLRIGVLGRDPFGPALDEALGGESVRGRPLAVRRASRVEELDDCQLVFIAASETRNAPAHLARLRDRPVLTVGEGDEFMRDGGGIAFYPEGRKIRFAINVHEVRRRGLRISAELLGLGKNVGETSMAGGP
mgnify:CR=1 FL=1|jgi:hypothetical protein